MKQEKEDKPVYQHANAPLRNWIVKWYGPRCKDYKTDCPTCMAWHCYDKIYIR